MKHTAITIGHKIIKEVLNFTYTLTLMLQSLHMGSLKPFSRLFQVISHPFLDPSKLNYRQIKPYQDPSTLLSSPRHDPSKLDQSISKQFKIKSEVLIIIPLGTSKSNCPILELILWLHDTSQPFCSITLDRFYTLLMFINHRYVQKAFGFFFSPLKNSTILHKNNERSSP